MTRVYVRKKLLVRDIKQLLANKLDKVNVFKSRDKVNIWVYHPEHEDEVLAVIHSKNLMAIPHTWPSNGMYTVEIAERNWV